MKPTYITRSPISSDRILFIYSKPLEGEVLCLWHEEATQYGEQLCADGWIHTATLSPEGWIPALLSARPDDASHMMDELNFGPMTKRKDDK